MSRLERLREAYRTVPPEGEHPAPETWEAFAAGELSGEEERRLVEHAISCPDCAAIHRAILEIRREARAFDPGAPRPRSHRAWPFPGATALLAAAAIVLAVSIVALFRAPHGPGGRPIARGPGAGTVHPVRPVGEITPPLPPFTWTVIPGVRGYVVEVLDESGHPAWRSPEVRGNAVKPPEGFPAAPGVYHWRVEVHPDPTGRPWFSETATFTVRRVSPGNPTRGAEGP